MKIFFDNLRDALGFHITPTTEQPKGRCVCALGLRSWAPGTSFAEKTARRNVAPEHWVFLAGTGGGGLAVEKMENLSEIGQCLRRWRCKVSVGSPLVIEGVRALSHTCFHKVCIFYGALGLGVYGCICARSAPQEDGFVGWVCATQGLDRQKWRSQRVKRKLKC